jgi:putative transposase
VDSTEAQVALVAKELAEARKAVAEGRATEARLVRRIHERFTWRMHDLSQFMQGFCNATRSGTTGRTKRKGHLWEDRFKSVIVEDGVAAKTMAAYIDLNPVRAGMVKNPEDYRWSSMGRRLAAGRRAMARRRGRAWCGRCGRTRAWRRMRRLDGRCGLEYRKILLAGRGRAGGGTGGAKRGDETHHETQGG